MSIGALIAIVFIAEWGLHYFPWRLLAKRELPRIPAYTLGVLAIFIPFSVWLWEHGYQQVLSVLWAGILSAGVSVSLWYAVDWLLDRINTASESEQRDTELRRRLQDSRNGES